METLTSTSSVVGNCYRPSAFLSAILSERFQVTVQDLNEGLVCLKPIGRTMKKAVYDTVISNWEDSDGSILQTRELRFKEWEEIDGDGIFQLALARYQYRKVKQVRVSHEDIKTASKREAQSKGNNSYRAYSNTSDSSASKKASVGEKRLAMLADI